jgi:hypothetical protein
LGDDEGDDCEEYVFIIIIIILLLLLIRGFRFTRIYEMKSERKIEAYGDDDELKYIILLYIKYN